jgi:ATP-dependent protease ClpP protease subunit
MTQAPDDSSVDPTRPLSAFEERLRAWQATSERRFEAKLAANDVLELQMLDSIGFDWWSGGGITSKSVQAKLDANKSAKTIKLLLHSGGGDAFEGLAIQALLKRHGARIEVEIIGLAASAASVIAMAGDTIAMHEGALMMIHAPWTCMCGDSSDMRSTADFLDKVNESALAVYTRRTGRARDEVAELVADETWMTAQEAVDAKFATSVIQGTTAEPQTKARAAASQVFMSMRQPRAALPNIQSPAVEQAEPATTESLATTTPAREGSAVPEPTTLAEEPPMTAQNTSFPTTIAIALGLPSGSTESDIQAALGRLRDFEREALSISGVAVSSEAIGTLRGFKAKADAHDKMALELSAVKAERDKQNFETLIANGKADGKLVPVTAKHYEEKFAVAVTNGRGTEFVDELRGFLSVAPRVLPQQVRQSAAAASGSGPGLYNGKTYAELKPLMRARLSQEDPDLYREMKRDFDANQSA